MSAQRANLIAVDGISGITLAAEARRIRKSSRGARAVISKWDASGLFEQMAMADDNAGAPSARTLLLLYAADLVFRLRWEIEPMLDEGRAVIAAPYVATAIAFGRAAGLTGGWLTNLFAFAPTPELRRRAAALPRAKPGGRGEGFVEFATRQTAGRVLGFTRQQVLARARARLEAFT